ncbi:MAG: hypothetical protein NW208_12645 [Bryobacter sp.]|nr:hypothetical protein [Bryobacter sp.]
MSAEDRQAGVGEPLGAVVGEMLRHPGRELVARWNRKSALTSALIRGAIFFFTNLSAGARAASGAWAAEFVWRFALSGFYGAITQRLRFATPRWAAMAAVGVGLPVFNHTLEFLIHSARGTPKLKLSILVSVIFTALSMLFNTYAMRRGVLVTGEGGQSLGEDFRQMPGVIGGFLLWLVGVKRG